MRSFFSYRAALAVFFLASTAAAGNEFEIDPKGPAPVHESFNAQGTAYTRSQTSRTLAGGSGGVWTRVVATSEDRRITSRGEGAKLAGLRAQLFARRVLHLPAAESRTATTAPYARSDGSVARLSYRVEGNHLVPLATEEAARRPDGRVVVTTHDMTAANAPAHHPAPSAHVVSNVPWSSPKLVTGAAPRTSTSVVLVPGMHR
jgi:hypothetical protein